MEAREVGVVTHYFGKASVAAIELTAPVAMGDIIIFKGATTGFEQEIDSMQCEHQDISKAKAGQAIGVKVREKVRNGDLVYKK